MTELVPFLNVMTDHGFDLIRYYADIYYREETDLEDHEDVDSEAALSIYSACWYGGHFFRWLFPRSGTMTDTLSANSFVHGYFDGDREFHYFFVITTDTEAIILNTYGGVPRLTINKLSLPAANQLISQIKRNNVSAITLLFKVEPDYHQIQITELTLEATDYQDISACFMLSKIEELLTQARATKDYNALATIGDNIRRLYID